MILVISYPSDPAASAGERLLQARGVPFARVEALKLLGDGSITLAFGARGGVKRRLVADGAAIDLDDVSAVWHRRHLVTGAAEITDPALRKLSMLETEAALLQTWSDLGVPFLPAPLAVLRAGQEKLRQLVLATRLGFEIPATLVTSDGEALLAFHREHGGRVITKLLASDSVSESGISNEFVRYTESLPMRDLAARDTARLCPIYAQARVPKAVELRVTVVGERVFAAEIHSQVGRHGRDDWRKSGPAAVPYAIHALPDDTAARCVAMTRALGLSYGAIDMVVRPDGAYVFLEINPAGEYHWVERRTGLPITAAIVDHLVAAAAASTRSQA